MEVSNFFTRLLHAPRENVKVKQVDDLVDFDAAWEGIKGTLEQPDERQLVRGISSTQVPAQLRHIVDALVYESNRTDEDTTGACLEYFLKNDLLAQLERLCEPDRPHGIKGETLRAINNLVVSLSERFLVHNAVHRPLRRLLRSCVGEEPEEKVDGGARVLGAAGTSLHEGPGANEEIEEDLVNLMCTLASRMVAYPPLLLIFFHDKGWLVPQHPLDRAMSPTPSGHTVASEPSTRTSARGTSSHHFEFLLFSYLLRFVHREGQIGDPARAGLLFLFDIAFLPSTDVSQGQTPRLDRSGPDPDPVQDARDALGEFILDGDFAEVMAAGLGAVYSLLPSKLRVPSLAALAETEEAAQATSSGGMHLGAGLDRGEDDIPSSTDPEVRTQLDLILRLFGFLQDIIYRCNLPILHTDDDEMSTAHMIGSAISEATLDAIQSSFLDNVLYPSILECSSHDGSAVAVLTYLDVVFSNLDEGPLLRRLLAFLMDTESSGVVDHQRKAKRKTGAMGYVGQPTYTADYFAEEGRFTLKDLILDDLRSSEWTASTAALRLLRTLLGSHCQHSVKGLLSVVRDPAATALARRGVPRGLDILPSPVNSTDVHLQEIELYSSLITRIDPLQPPLEVAAGYAVYLADMQAALEADACYRSAHVPLEFLALEDEKGALVRAGTADEPFQHRLGPSDPLIRAVLELMAGFLGNTPDENVALTGALTAIALCPNRSLAGWLLYDIRSEDDPWEGRSHGEKDSVDIDLGGDGEGSDAGSDIDIERAGVEQDPFSARASVTLPAIYQILRELVKTISTFRAEIDSFDRLLSERRQGLLFADHLDEAMNLMLDVEPTAFGLASTPTRTPQAKPKRPSMGLANSIKSFLTPKRKVGATTPTPTSTGRSTPLGGLFGSVTTPSKAVGTEDSNGQTDGAEEEAPSTPLRSSPAPFRSHYEQTSVSLEVQGGTPTAIASGPWSPAGVGDLQPAMSALELDDEVVRGPRQVRLGVILDNCVVLEEFIKELVAVITARRALGVDQVGYI